MTQQSPFMIPGLAPDTVVQNVNLNQTSDGTPTMLAAGRHEDQYVSRVHGARYAKASRGNLFWGSSGVAGASLIAPGQTTGSFILFNPVGSGILMEVEKFRVSGASTETDVIAGLALEAGVQTPTGTLTGATIVSALLGGSLTAGNAKGKVFKAATIAAMTFIGGLGLTIQATAEPMPNGEIDFDGTLVLSPGTAINFVSTITQGANILVCDVLWSEWLA